MTKLSPEWQEYVDALERCYKAVELTAFHVRECANAVEQVAIQTGLTAFYLKEAANLEVERARIGSGEY